MEGVPDGKGEGILALKAGLFTGLAVLSLSYPVVFLFGLSRISMIVLMYSVILSSLASIAAFLLLRRNAMKKSMAGRAYRVVHAGGEFVDRLLSVDGNLLVFGKRAINRNAVYVMEAVEKGKEGENTLHEYFH